MRTSKPQKHYEYDGTYQGGLEYRVLDKTSGRITTVVARDIRLQALSQEIEQVLRIDRAKRTALWATISVFLVGLIGFLAKYRRRFSWRRVTHRSGNASGSHDVCWLCLDLFRRHGFEDATPQLFGSSPPVMNEPRKVMERVSNA